MAVVAELDATQSRVRVEMSQKFVVALIIRILYTTYVYISLVIFIGYNWPQSVILPLTRLVYTHAAGPFCFGVFT